jgi:precorrin-8X/cobalt-precorrin-8 methylmutase
MTKPLFDSYLVVDWSAAGKPVTGSDSIWLAHIQDGRLALSNPATRHEAVAEIAGHLNAATRHGKRLLAGFDFPFGYPAGLARSLAANGDWQTVWAWLAAHIEDDADNQNNRFDVAARLNANFPGDGPFWGNGLGRDIPGLPRKKPTGWGAALPENQRDCDRRASKAQEVWKLSGIGSVGGQALTGIARLEQLRRDHGVTIWPFQSDGIGASHVFAEVFPSLVPLSFAEGTVKDAVQVETLARALARLDQCGDLAEILNAPARLPAETRSHEATILGLDHQPLLAAACKAEQGATLRPVPPYIKDPAAIYAKSFATVREEARLERFDAGMAALATRLIHACGMVDVADRLAFSKEAYLAGHRALQQGAPILCDCEMAGAGIIRRYLPAANEVIVTLNDPSVPELAHHLGTTRSAAAVDLWRDRIEGAVVAIGNAPTALFHLLERLDQGWPRPAVILGFPVGFVGAAESKAELAGHPRGCEFVALRGRRGGSAMVSAAVNALAAGLPEEAVK